MTRPIIVLTAELIDKGKSLAGGWNKKQLAVLGISWPPYKGWKRDLIGKILYEDVYQRFLELSPSFGTNRNILSSLELETEIAITFSLTCSACKDTICRTNGTMEDFVKFAVRCDWKVDPKTEKALCPVHHPIDSPS